MRRLAGALILLTLLAGCDDDGSAVGGRAVRLAAYCDSVVAVETTFAGVLATLGPYALDRELTPALVKAAKDSTPARRRAVRNAPDAVSDDVRVVDAALERLANARDVAATRTPRYEEASRRTHDFEVNNCAWNVVNVTASDHRYDGVPNMTRPGTATFEMTNRGTEWHELLIVRKKPGVTDTFDALIAGDRLRQSTTAFAEAFAGAGDTAYALVRLEPGSYLAVCLLPQGTVGEMRGTGPPHARLGMRAEFTVE